MGMKRRHFLHTRRVGVPRWAQPTFAASAEATSAAPKDKLRILILGGTGFTGPHQVRYALERGHHVTLFNRGRRAAAVAGRRRRAHRRPQHRRPEGARGRRMGRLHRQPDDAAVLGARRRPGAAGAGCGQYIFISTISVYADNDKADRTSPPRLAAYKGADAMAETQDTLKANMALYGPLKALSEEEARRQFGAGTTVIRPGLIVGPGDETDRFTYWPVRMARGGEVLAPGDGPIRCSSSTRATSPSGRSAWPSRARPAPSTPPARRTPLDMREMLDGIGAAVRSDARLTWVPTEFLEEQKVSGLERPAGVGAGRGRQHRLRPPRHRPRPACRPDVSGRSRRPRSTRWPGFASSRPRARPS